MKHPALKIAFASLLTLAGCGQAPTEQHTSYETLTLTKSNVTVPISWSAAIVGKNDVSITPQTSGQLVKVCVTEGEKVKKGQTLFILDSRKAEAEVANAKANLLAAQATCNSAELEYRSNSNLFEKKIVSEYILNTAKNEFERAKAAVEQAKAAVDRAVLELSYCTINSPVSGIVGSIPQNPGDQVGILTQLTTVAGISEMTAKFSITENQVQTLISGAGSIDKALKMMPEVTLSLKNGTQYAHKGKITSISGVVDQTTGSVTCRADFPNPEGSLYSGTQGTVTMELSYENEIVIPLSAVVRLQDKTIVYKVKDNFAESVIVRIEELGNGRDAAIIAGLGEGDTIVTIGAANVYDGQQVIFPETESK